MSTIHTNYAAWRPAADTIADLTFEQYRRLFIHETPQISRFLAEFRAEHFIISAPKGFGKTLLLIAKRMQLNERSPELDRGGEIVDRPPGSFPEVGKNRMNEYKSDFELWRRIWHYSLTVAAINAHGRSPAANRKTEQEDEGYTRQVQLLDRWTQELLKDSDRFRSPTLVFTSLLDLDYSTRQKALGSINGLNILLSGVQSQVAFFIDNVDEYFAPALENHSKTAGERGLGEAQRKSNEIWINAQLALVAVAFQIHRVNHHVRIYCTVRREAFLKLHEKDSEYAQIRGCTVEISYDRSDLEIIFQKNVKLMNKEGLFVDAGPDSIALLFGPAAKVLRHRLMDRAESAFEYILRHTFYRPRDLMEICGKIADIAVEERHPSRIRDVVEEESAHLVREIFTEMKPFFHLPDLDELLSCIRKNVLSASDLDLATEEYIQKLQKADSSIDEWEIDHRQPFSILYQIGMLGWVQANPGQNQVDIQRFVKPRNVEVGKLLGLPPTEKVYLIHPALDNMISARVGREYSRQFHSTNVIGTDLPWREPAASLFVVKGDVCGFSRLMETEFYQTVAIKLHQWAKTACGDLDFVEVTGGDSITMIDRSADKLVDAVFELLRRAALYREHPLTFRFGGSAGPITFEKVERRVESKWETLTLPLGQALRSGARLEPHAPRGKLMVDNTFVQAIGDRLERLLIEELLPEEVPSLLYNSDTKSFVVQKSTTDPSHETQLYLLRFAEQTQAVGASATR